MRVEIRRGAPGDIDWLIGQLREFSSFMGTKRALFGDEEYVRRQVEGMLEHHVIFLAVREDGERMGFIGGVYVPHVFNPELTLLSETFWWVTPAHRGSRAGLMLLNAFTEFGKGAADWVTVALEEKSPVDDRCLRKRGYRLLEKNYLLEVS
jgi:hypothetical protein